MQTESSNLIMNGLNPPTHHQVTEQLMVPDQLVGLIIGKQGEVRNQVTLDVLTVTVILANKPHPTRNWMSCSNRAALYRHI